MQYDKSDLDSSPIENKPLLIQSSSEHSTTTSASIDCELEKINDETKISNDKQYENQDNNGHVIDVSISPDGRAAIMNEKNFSKASNKLDNDSSQQTDRENINSEVNSVENIAKCQQDDNEDYDMNGNNESLHQEDGKGDKQYEEPEQTRKLFIGGLDYKTSEETLRQHFEQFGDVIDCIVMREPQTRRSRGFGFVTYASSSMIDKAQSARPHRVDGREVEPKRAIPRGESGKPETQATVKKVFLGGLSDNLTDSDLKEYFKEFGNIVSITIATQKDTGKKRGFAFVEFDDYDPVDKIVLKKHHLIKDTRLEVKKAIPKTEMDARRGDPRMGGSLTGPMSAISARHPKHLPNPRVSNRGIRNGNYVWDNGNYTGLESFPMNYPSQPNHPYPPHYQSAGHYNSANWMLYGHGGSNSRGPYNPNSYGRAYMEPEGSWMNGEHAMDHTLPIAGNIGPVRSSHLYRSNGGPYGGGFGSHRGRNY